MFDLKFHTSVLDKMPVGTSFKDSGHLIVKKSGGWTCEDCYIVTPDSSSSAYMSTPSREIALDKFAGAEIDPNDLDPRLLAFLPAGTKVADNNTEKYEGWYWFKTKSGRWVWAMEVEGAETTANYGIGIEDMSDKHYLRPFRLVSPDTTKAPDIDELNLIDNKILLDDDGDRWVKVGDKWYILYSEGIGGLPWGDSLNPSYGPYEIAEEFQELTEQQAKTLKGKVLVDREGDLWAFFNDSWHFRSGSLFIQFGGPDPLVGYEPFTLHHDQSVHPKSSETPEVETPSESDGTPTDPARLTAAEATALRDIVYDNGGGKWIYTSEGGYRLKLGRNLLGKLCEQLPADYAPYFTEDPRAEYAPEPEAEAEPEPETEKIPEGKTRFSAAEATNFKDCRFRDRDDDVWLFDEETDRWRFIRADGSLSVAFQHVALIAALEPFTLVEGEIKAEAEPETEADPAEKTEFSAEEASENKDLVFKDGDGDTWFFDYGMQRWRAIGSDWAYAKERLSSSYGPYTKVGPLYEFNRPWTAEEASEFKDEALEDSDGDIWIYDAPSEMWKCSHSGALDRDELGEAFQPYRIKKAASAGYNKPLSSTEEITYEGSAKEAVEILDRIAKALESIDRKLGDK